MHYTEDWKNMAYKKHILGLLIRLILIFINLLLLSQIIFNAERLFSIIILISILTLQLGEFIRRELKLFNSFEEYLKTVEFEDRSVKFISNLPKGLQSLADMFNKLLEVIEKKRIENQAQYIFLEELLKNVKVGVLTVSDQEKVELANPIALQILRLNSIHKLSQLKSSSEQLYEAIVSCKSELSTIIESDNYSLSLQVNHLSIQGKKIKLISFQDIKHQIELKEMQAWHQLIRTLGHEILNSVTPISSMTETGLMLLQDDQKQAKQIEDLSQAQLEKIRNALQTVNRRSNSLLAFIENYRKLTRMPFTP